ncbi:MAG: NADH:ubiquinone oxidoreductase subunit C [Deltaproteobacteria bacterium]|nr:MAG: NADH:ubiquinone oxidoreductase subunit C [Deltaproteobacteria bacterium]
MSDALKSFSFAIILGIVCSLLLTTAATGLKKYQLRNIRIDRQKNILKAVRLLDEKKTYTADDIETLFTKNMRVLFVDHTGRIIQPDNRKPGDLPIWLYGEEDTVKAYVVPVDTNGLWGKIRGYLAFEADGVTVRGFTVFKHSETPGLGGEIEKRWFQKNFVGKKIVNAAGKFVSIGIAKGAVKNNIPREKRENYVDGISGATMTGKFLSAGLKDILRNYEPVAIKFRRQQCGKVTLCQ